MPAHSSERAAAQDRTWPRAAVKANRRRSGAGPQRRPNKNTTMTRTLLYVLLLGATAALRQKGPLGINRGGIRQKGPSPSAEAARAPSASSSSKNWLTSSRARRARSRTPGRRRRGFETGRRLAHARASLEGSTGAGRRGGPSFSVEISVGIIREERQLDSKTITTATSGDFIGYGADGLPEAQSRSALKKTTAVLRGCEVTM